MQFTFGIVKNEQSLNVLDFSSEGVRSKTVDLELLTDQNLQALFFPEDVPMRAFEEIIEREKRYYPVRPLTFNDHGITFEQGISTLRKTQESWVLGNNLNLTENIFETSAHLKNLLKKERDLFFEELWFLLRNNLGTRELTFIYNNLEKKDDEKKKLIKTRIDGKRLPSPTTGGVAEEQIFNHYQKEFGNPFQVIEYDVVKGEMVATLSIYQSPVLVMAKLYNVNEIQKRVLTALFKSLKD